jgi:hypothetical protein
MFLKNERGMGVKNGSLGVIEQVSRVQMGVRLDDGRQVAFDLKDYAHVDHGYAATVHKSQGVTVDQAHVLATPGMDRHSAYVALSRHRDAVQLHYGRDDFADRDRLVRTLGRERAKDMASDYVRAEPEQAKAFAELRGFVGEIRIAERVREIVVQVQDKAREVASSSLSRAFAGFRPTSALPARAVSDVKRAPDQARAITRYARAAVDIDRMQDKGLPVLPHQAQALAKAAQALDLVRPNAARDLASAIKSSPEVAREAVGGNIGSATRGMAQEARVRHDPELRADRFVEQWQGMMLERAGPDPAITAKATMSMGTMVEGLRSDPALARALERRMPELAVKMDHGQSVEKSLKASIAVDRVHDRSMGMEW